MVKECGMWKVEEKYVWTSKDELSAVTSKNYGPYLFDSSNNYFIVTKDEAESLALALLDDLGKGWKPYPENKPDFGMYNVTPDDGQVMPATYVPAQNKWHDGIIYNSLPLKVIAYCELPAPFQPEEQ